MKRSTVPKKHTARLFRHPMAHPAARMANPPTIPTGMGACASPKGMATG